MNIIYYSLIILLNILDAYMTKYSLTVGGTETNPIMQYLFSINISLGIFIKVLVSVIAIIGLYIGYIYLNNYTIYENTVKKGMIYYKLGIVIMISIPLVGFLTGFLGVIYYGLY